jgi:gas vesicle protein
MRRRIMSETTGSRSGGVLAGLAIGAAIGAGVALLYAPQSGKNTRSMLADKGRKLRGKASGALENGKGYVREKKAVLAAAVEGGKEAMREERAEHN